MDRKNSQDSVQKMPANGIMLRILGYTIDRVHPAVYL